jgi:hypothetical protein
MNVLRNTVSILFLVLFAVTARAGDDPFVGLWVLDVANSQYPSGTGPESMIVEMKPAGNGVQYRSDAQYANGRMVHSEYTADYDGNQAIVMGNRGMMFPVFLKRVDSRVVVASYTKSLQIVATSERVVSPDGLHMTITTIATTPSGQKVTTVGIFNKRIPPASLNPALMSKSLGRSPRSLSNDQRKGRCV